MEEDKLTAPLNGSFGEGQALPSQLPDQLPVPPEAEQFIIPKSFARKLANVPQSQHDCYECMMTCFGECTGCFGAYVPLCCCCGNSYVTIQQGFVGIMTKFGKAYKIVDPGLYFVNQMTEKVHLVDVKICITNIPKQVVMTRDNVSVIIDSVVYWHVIDPFISEFHVGNVTTALAERTMTTLRDTVGAHVLQNVIENREALAAEIRKIIASTALSWGVVVEAILIKDMTFSQDLQENLASAAKQQRLGESKIIMAKAEVQASKLMREASDILNTPAAMQIRYLETLASMAHQAGTKVIFMPADPETGLSRAKKEMAAISNAKLPTMP